MSQYPRFYSTNRKAEPASFKDALIKGLAPDRGLYMPEFIPAFAPGELDSFASKTYPEIAAAIFGKFYNCDVPAAELAAITADAYNYEVPLERAANGRYIMRLDQGPTASFKDFAARMMGRLMQYFLGKEGKSITILTATSGDTGSAMASAFYGLHNVEVVILFPEAEVSPRQRLQMTTLRGNVRSIAIDGKFDDCQAFVKEAFADPELAHLSLSSANSINIGRLLPQVVYYVYAYSRLAKPGQEIIFSVPSGNFGDLMGGVIAKHMGLPVRKFVVATNMNDEFPRLLETRRYAKVEPSANCLSNAMNVGHPSNLARLIELYGGNMDEKGTIHQQPDYDKIGSDFYAEAISDERTRAAIAEAYRSHGVLLEPHGAVGWAAMDSYQSQHPEQCEGVPVVCLETAHPAKFPDSIIDILGIDPALPASMAGLEGKIEQLFRMPTQYQAFKAFLLEK